MPSASIALAGATGNLGMPILEVLPGANYRVTVLSRVSGNSSRLRPNLNLTIKEVDFNSIESLIPALLGVNVVVSCLATLAIGCQNPLIDVSVAAGVKRFIPAEFGMDSQNPFSAQLPVCAPKAATQEYLLEKSGSNPGFTYTAIANGLFLDWGLKMGIIVNPTQHTAVLYNGGDVPFSATNLTDVAKAVLGIINHRAQTANRVLYVHSVLVTQNQLNKYAKDKDGKEWNIVYKDTEQVRQEILAELAKGSGGDMEAAMLGFCFVGSHDTKYGCDFSSHLDNELLSVEELNEAELRKLVESFL
ncbi:oxidoreductase CipA-like protein [Lojkania enalia]|uniref:Oxidoreductase CipA-like protein n=1 Tax=Lojkania enalia TaxID=147567 RepID=A0A9P4N4E0_9PLEO|nr:oxidoreductase CipA-like protein [Didymosphaeria enalia]